jgi:hypothetical protein
MKVDKQINYWKVIAILFFLFGVVLFFYSESKDKQTVNDYNNCRTILNQTVNGWHDSMIYFGKICFNISEKEVESVISKDFNKSLNLKEVTK